MSASAESVGQTSSKALNHVLQAQAARKGRTVKQLVGNMAAGGSSAVLARVVIAPMERIKIRYQVTLNITLSDVVRAIYREEGILGYWRGVGASVTRVAPYFGIKFMSLERYKEGMKAAGLPQPVCAFLGGSLAGMTAVVATYPFDIMRARMAALEVTTQAKAKTTYRSMFREIYSQRGIAGLYRGMSITLKGICLHDGVKFGLYDIGKGQIVSAFQKEPKDLPFWGRVVSGALSGLVAQTVAYPTDVLRRRVQTSDSAKVPYRGIIQGMLKIYREEGFAGGLFRGWTVNCLKAMPNIAMYMSMYDLMTMRLRSWGW
eukprot:RCo054220